MTLQANGRLSISQAGRKKKADCLISCIKDELARIESAGSPLTREQMIAGCLVDKAVAGNLEAIKILLDYTAIKPAQAVNLGMGDSGKIELIVRYAKPEVENASR